MSNKRKIAWRRFKNNIGASLMHSAKEPKAEAIMQKD
jgi:hypothetical protein